MTAAGCDIQSVFRQLEAHFGQQQWWPAETPFEVIVGAILTQNTAWTNVEKAIANLRAAGALSPTAIRRLPIGELELLIRPAGFFRQKAVRLRHVTTVLVEHYAGSVENLCAGSLDEARRRLLALPGIGPETADSILLYAAHRPSFVVDAYTRRIFARLGLLAGTESYEVVRTRFMSELPTDVPLFNEYHALIVTLAKRHCRKQRPDCPACPLCPVCRHARRGGLTSG
ncbi:MAG: endonuclease III domain-containing protein [Desulfuromonas sp.]|nr:endonuclease III domain-containing protein [Desulfuromonas sp.]